MDTVEIEVLRAVIAIAEIILELSELFRIDSPWDYYEILN